jgi:hypothetical protein
VFAACLCLIVAAAASDLKVVESVQPQFEVAGWRLYDVNRDGSKDLLLIGAEGEVRTWVADPQTGKFEAKPRGSLVLPHPAHTLLAVADFMADGSPPQLLTLSPGGTMLYRPGPDGAFEAEPVRLSKRAKFTLRTNEPVFSAVVQDVNNDGKPDLVVPGQDRTELWIMGNKRLRRTARIAVDVDRFERMQNRRLSDRYESYFRVPRLATIDVNGDGRPDLYVKTGRTRSFHMQREDGTIPPEADVSVNLDIFKDTTPQASMRPGKVLAGSDRTRYKSRDLDGDKIPDYVIAHRRKVWIFHGNNKRPQFVEPTTILKVNDDITSLMLVQLDGDALPDLLLFKIQIPSISSLVFGLLSSIEIDITSLGYRNLGNRKFARTPTWRSEITVTLPPLMSVLKDPGKLLGRFEDVGKKFRIRRTADLDGDGKDEILLLSQDRGRIDVWWLSDEARKRDALQVEGMIRRLLFEDENKDWDLERILSFLGGIADRRTAELTGGRDPNLTFALRDPEKYDFLDLAIGRVGTQKGQAVVLRYLPAGGGAVPVFDIVRLAQ